jgi:hypothetical protein
MLTAPRRNTLQRLLELLLQLASLPQALLARARGRERIRALSVAAADRQPSLSAVRQPSLPGVQSPPSSPMRSSTRTSTHSSLLAKTVHLNVEQARPFCSNRVITSRYTALTFVPASLLSLLKCAPAILSQRRSTAARRLPASASHTVSAASPACIKSMPTVSPGSRFRSVGYWQLASPLTRHVLTLPPTPPARSTRSPTSTFCASGACRPCPPSQSPRDARAHSCRSRLCYSWTC